MISVEPLEMLLPGVWRLSFVNDVQNTTGAGEYTFKLAGTFNANVRDIYSGRALWHGYWQVENARLILNAQQVDSRCNSCLGSGNAYDWILELEQVQDDAFSGLLVTNEFPDGAEVVFQRID